LYKWIYSDNTPHHAGQLCVGWLSFKVKEVNSFMLAGLQNLFCQIVLNIKYEVSDAVGCKKPNPNTTYWPKKSAYCH
jgi:hypothetical protein